MKTFDISDQELVLHALIHLQLSTNVGENMYPGENVVNIPWRKRTQDFSWKKKLYSVEI